MRTTKVAVRNSRKFLVSRDGQVVGRYEPKVEPEAIAKDIEAELKKQP
jgi:glutathione peroxidase-family protein